VLCYAVSSTFTCTLKFVVKDCDPNTGEPDDDGYEDEYVVCFLCLSVAFTVFVKLFLLFNKIFSHALDRFESSV